MMLEIDMLDEAPEEGGQAEAVDESCRRNG